MNPASPIPLIGLTCCSDKGLDWIPHAPEKYLDFLFRDYQRGVEFAGGIPVLVPIVKDFSTINALLDRIDGLILTGDLMSQNDSMGKNQQSAYGGWITREI